EVSRVFADKRRTEVSAIEENGFEEEDFIKDEQVVVTISNAGYAKRSSTEQYRAQGRGGKGIRGAATGAQDDFVSDIFAASTRSYILCFSNLGKLHWLKVHKIPEMSRTARGRPLVQMLSLAQNEKILSILPVEEFKEDRFVVMATKRGVIKKTELMSFSNVRTAGIIAIGIDEGDELVGAALTNGKDDIFLASK